MTEQQQPYEYEKPRVVLHERVPLAHTPRNVNAQHRRALASAGVNTRLAVMLTRTVGTMPTAYLFGVIGIGSLVGVFTGDVFLALLFGSISSYLLQLILLPIIMTGQNVLGQHAELLAEEQYATTRKSEHEIEQILQHLAAQDAELLKQTAALKVLLNREPGRPGRGSRP